MTARIRIPQRIVANIARTVEALRAGRVGDEGIGLDKAREDGVVVARVVEVERRRVIEDLPGTLKGASLIAAVGRRVARRAGARLAPRIVADIGHLLRAAVQPHRAGAEVVGDSIPRRKWNDALPGHWHVQAWRRAAHPQREFIG